MLSLLHGGSIDSLSALDLRRSIMSFIPLRATAYVVRQHGGYPDDVSSYKVCATRAEVEAELVDLGYMDNPGVWVYKCTKADKSPSEVIQQLANNPDPYPDWVVEFGPRGGVQWSIA
jgi:hypothetical protein